jgi:hypothetical protein
LCPELNAERESERLERAPWGRSAAIWAPQSVRVAGEEEVKLDVDW